MDSRTKRILSMIDGILGGCTCHYSYYVENNNAKDGESPIDKRIKSILHKNARSIAEFLSN